MRKLISIAAAALLLFLTMQAAGAEPADTYRIEKLGMTLKIPSRLVVVTRENVGRMGGKLGELGLSADDVKEQLNSSHIYLTAMPYGLDYEIAVIMVDNTIRDMDRFTDQELMEMAEGFDSELLSYGIEYLRSEIYHHPQKKFLKIYSRQQTSGTSIRNLQYYTICNYQAISVTLKSYTGAITAENEACMKKIVDSIVFDTAETSSVTSAVTSAAAIGGGAGNTTGGRKGGTGHGQWRAVLLAILFNTLPIVIYRFGIHKEPVTKEKGRVIMVLYTVVAVLATMFSLGYAAAAAALICCIADYIILLYRPCETAAAGGVAPQSDPGGEEREKWCDQCGAPLQGTAHYCKVCGRRIK